MSIPFFGRDAELALLQQRWHASTNGRGPNFVTLVGETGVGKSRIVQEFYRQLTVDAHWDPDHFWPDDFQTHATQLRVNPEFAGTAPPSGPPRFLWLGVRWSNHNERNVANSMALPTLNEHLSAIAAQARQARPRPQRLLEAVKNDAVSIGKELATGHIEDLVDGVMSSIVPYYKLLTMVYGMANETREVLGFGHAPPTLHDQLSEFFGRWFAQKPVIPVVLWLDDVHWIDSEALHFFTHLSETAHAHQWPLLVVATCWPSEWHALPESFFLKPEQQESRSAWPAVVVHHVEAASPPALTALLTSAFPTLPAEQVTLLVERAGGNFLTMVENITELRSKPRYFVANDPQQPLSAHGLERIRTWQSNREVRIQQRFNEEFDTTVQECLARASQAGVDTQFLRHVLVRFATLHPEVGDIDTTLRDCQERLAIVAPLSHNVHEFRDRGYFAVARTYFAAWLEQSESATLRQAIITELTEHIQRHFNDQGELLPVHEHTPRGNIHDHAAMLRLAQQVFGTDAPVTVQAVAVYADFCVHHHTWHALHRLAPIISQITWHTHGGLSIAWSAVERVAQACAKAGMPVAHTLYQHLLAGATHHPLPTERQIAMVCALGQIAYQHDDIPAATTYFATALTQLEQQSPPAPHQLASVLRDLGTLARLRHDETQAQTYYQRARDIALQHAEQSNTSTAWLVVASIHHALGQLALAQSNLTLAQAVFAADITVCERILATFAATDIPSAVYEHYAMALNSHGDVALRQGDHATALQRFHTALDICTHIATIRGTPDDIDALASSHVLYGGLAHRQGDMQTAAHHLTTGVHTARRVVGMRGTPADHAHLAWSLQSYAEYLCDQGDSTSARACAHEALEIARQHAQSHPHLDTQRALVVALISVGVTCGVAELWHDALSAYREAQTIAAQRIAARGNDDDWHLLLATQIGTAKAATQCNEHDLAHAERTQAIATATRLHATAPHLVSAQEVADLHAQTSTVADIPAPTTPAATPQLERTTLILTLVLVIAFIIWRILMR